MVVSVILLVPAVIFGALGLLFLRIGRRSSRSDRAFVGYAVSTSARVIAVNERGPNPRYFSTAVAATDPARAHDQMTSFFPVVTFDLPNG